MCYNITSALQTQLKRAIHHNKKDEIEKLLKQLEKHGITSHYQLSGFEHRPIIIYTSKEPITPTPSIWGLIPDWVKDEQQKLQIWNNTLNARGESIFDKVSFKKSIKEKRCVIYVDGFYEHHYLGKKTFPHLITSENDQPLVFAGIYDEWLVPKTGELIHSFSIVTTKANEMMAKIHNNPKLNEPRMPLMLNESEEEIWLKSDTSETFMNEIKSIINKKENQELKSHTVRKLSGKGSVGNTIEAQNVFYYDELNTLFS